MKRKQWLRFAAFLVLAALLAGGLSWLLRDRHTTLSCLYSEPEDSLDLLAVGSSHVNSGIIPSLFWQQEGISACNVYSWSQPMWISYHYIKEALKTQQPAAILLETFGMTYGHSSIMPQAIDRTSYENSFDIDPGLNFLQMARTVEFCGLDLRQWEDFLPLARYHTRWKSPKAEMLTYDPHDDPDPLKGYGLVLTASAQQKPDIPAQPPLEPYEYSVLYLDKIAELCRREGIQLILVTTPYVYNEAEAGIFAWLAEYAQGQGIPYINYNGPEGERIGFDYARDLADWGHLNFYGAQKVTADLCRFVTEEAGVRPADHGADAARLDGQLAYYQRVLEAQPLLTEADLSAWLAAVAADENLTVFLLSAGAGQPAKAALRAALGTAEDCLVLEGGAARPAGGRLDFPLFDGQGTVELLPGEGQILLNGEPAPLQGGEVLAVVWDEVLGRPLDCAVYDGNTLTHREFTSDLLDAYR